MWWWVYTRVRGLLRWRRQQADLDEEIRFHLSEETDRGVAAGLPGGEAARAARRDFGNVPLTADRVRDVWLWPWLTDLGRDARLGARPIGRDRPRGWSAVPSR